MKTKSRRKASNRRTSLSAPLREAFTQAIANIITGRTQLAGDLKNATDAIDPPGRDLDYECGYPTNPSIQTYRKLYQRSEYARRVNDVWSDECWAVRPALYETEEMRVTKFERAFDKLNTRLNLWHYLHRLDRICGIGAFGVLLLGINDGKNLAEPVRGVRRDGTIKQKSGKPLDLLYVRPFAQDSVRVAKVEEDKSNPRYGQPRWYDIDVTKATDEDAGTRTNGDETVVTIRVHWSRVIHVADNTESSDLYGSPRMESVLNRLLDIRKTLSGSAEMFWKGAFPGYSFETMPELLGESTMDEDSIREQFEEYMEGLKRYLALDGATVKQLAPQVADPTQHVVQQISAICACIGVPLRIFMGSESGHLASTQDSMNMNKRVSRRQTLFCEPMIIRPLVDRLIAFGILPEPPEGYLISWTDLNTMADKDKALVSLQRTQALMQYVEGGVEAIMPPEQFYTIILGLTAEETNAVMDAVASKAKDTYTDPLGDMAAARDTALEIKKGKAMPKPAPAKARTQGGGRIGKPARTRPAGRPPGKIQRNVNRVFQLN